jgi:hypothetical protein
MGLHSLVQAYLYFLYVEDVHTLQETHLWLSKAFYRNSFTCYM